MDESTQRLFDALEKGAETWRQKYDDLCCDFEHVSAERDAEKTNAKVWREKYEKLSVEMEQLGAEGYGKEIESNAKIEKLQAALKASEDMRQIAERREASAKADLEAVERESRRRQTEIDDCMIETVQLQKKNKQLQAALAEICIRAFCGGDTCE